MTETEQREAPLHTNDPRNAAKIASRLTRRDITAGDIAGLKRLNSRQPTDRTFWKVCLEIGIDKAETELVEVWAEIFRMIAAGTKVSKTHTTGPHDGNVPLGRALALSGYSESRMKTLLDANATALPSIGERMTRYLKSHEQKFNWNDAARLMLTKYRTPEERDEDRTRIARDYHRQRH